MRMHDGDGTRADRCLSKPVATRSARFGDRQKGVIKRGMSSSAGEKTRATDASTVVLEIVGEMSPSGVTDVESDAELVGELGFDSLGLVELLVVLEDVFDLPPIDIEALGELDRVADLQRVVHEAQAQMPLVKEAVSEIT